MHLTVAPTPGPLKPNKGAQGKIGFEFSSDLGLRASLYKTKLSPKSPNPDSHKRLCTLSLGSNLRP